MYFLKDSLALLLIALLMNDIIFFLQGNKISQIIATDYLSLMACSLLILADKTLRKKQGV